MTISLGQIMTWITQGVTIALILIFAVTIAQQFGLRIPMIPTMQPLNMLYFAAAWAFLQGKVKLG